MTSEDPGDWKTVVPRDPPEMGRREAEERLLAHLNRAAELMDSAEDFGRSGIMLAVQACGSFLLVRGASGFQVKPLRDLIDALRSVEAGTLPELFDPQAGAVAVSGRKRSRSPAAQEVKIYSAACLDALMTVKCHESLGQAASYVARQVTAWPQIGKPDISATTIINWRKDLRARPSADRGRAFFEGLARDLASAASPKEEIDAQLRHGPPATGGIRTRRSES